MNNEIVLQMKSTPQNARNSEGAFVTLRDGRIAFAWSKYTTQIGGDHGPASLACLFSADQGRTWDDETILVEPAPGEANVMSVSLLRLQDGRILLTYARKIDHGDGTIDCRPVVRFSEDELQTLSAPQLATPVPGYYVINNDRVIQLQSGRLLMPLALHRIRLPWQPPSDGFIAAKMSGSALILFLHSDDGGANWLESVYPLCAVFPTGTGFQEPGGIELRNGELWGWMRTGWSDGDPLGSRQWETRSSDAGLTWSSPQPSVFVSPCSPLSMKRLPQTGELLAVWNDHSGHFDLPEPQPGTGRRTPLVSALSADDGRTWKHHQLLEGAPDRGFSYTAIHFTNDAVLLAYNAGSNSIGSRLRLRRIAVDALYAE